MSSLDQIKHRRFEVAPEYTMQNFGEVFGRHPLGVITDNDLMNLVRYCVWMLKANDGSVDRHTAIISVCQEELHRRQNLEMYAEARRQAEDSSRHSFFALIAVVAVGALQVAATVFQTFHACKP